MGRQESRRGNFSRNFGDWRFHAGANSTGAVTAKDPIAPAIHGEPDWWWRTIPGITKVIVREPDYIPCSGGD